jgi:hypothetical protein
MPVRRMPRTRTRCMRVRPPTPFRLTNPTLRGGCRWWASCWCWLGSWRSRCTNPRATPRPRKQQARIQRRPSSRLRPPHRVPRAPKQKAPERPSKPRVGWLCRPALEQCACPVCRRACCPPCAGRLLEPPVRGRARCRGPSFYVSGSKYLSPSARSCGKRPPPCRGCSSVGRALAWHARGQGFDSPQLHKVGPVERPGFLLL